MISKKNINVARKGVAQPCQYYIIQTNKGVKVIDNRNVERGHKETPEKDPLLLEDPLNVGNHVGPGLPVGYPPPSRNLSRSSNLSRGEIREVDVTKIVQDEGGISSAEITAKQEVGTAPVGTGNWGDVFSGNQHSSKKSRLSLEEKEILDMLEITIDDDTDEEQEKDAITKGAGSGGNDQPEVAKGLGTNAELIDKVGGKRLRKLDQGQRSTNKTLLDAFPVIGVHEDARNLNGGVVNVNKSVKVYPGPKANRIREEEIPKEKVCLEVGKDHKNMPCSENGNGLEVVKPQQGQLKRLREDDCLEVKKKLGAIIHHDSSEKKQKTGKEMEAPRPGDSLKVQNKITNNGRETAIPPVTSRNATHSAVSGAIKQSDETKNLSKKVISREAPTLSNGDQLMINPSAFLTPLENRKVATRSDSRNLIREVLSRASAVKQSIVPSTIIGPTASRSTASTLLNIMTNQKTGTANISKSISSPDSNSMPCTETNSTAISTTDPSKTGNAQIISIAVDPKDAISKDPKDTIPTIPKDIFAQSAENPIATAPDALDTAVLSTPSVSVHDSPAGINSSNLTSTAPNTTTVTVPDTPSNTAPKHKLARDKPATRKKHDVDRTRAKKGWYCICNSNRRFGTVYRLKDHIKYYTQEPKFACKHCSYCGVQLSLLKKHMLSAHKIQSISGTIGCGDCGAVFADKEKYKAHRLADHNRSATTIRKHAVNESDPGKLKCIVADQLELRRHQDSEHPETKRVQKSNPATAKDLPSRKSHQCHKCGQIFEYLSILKRHEIRVHLKEKDKVGAKGEVAKKLQRKQSKINTVEKSVQESSPKSDSDSVLKLSSKIPREGQMVLQRGRGTPRKSESAPTTAKMTDPLTKNLSEIKTDSRTSPKRQETSEATSESPRGRSPRLVTGLRLRGVRPPKFEAALQILRGKRPKSETTSKPKQEKPPKPKALVQPNANEGPAKLNNNAIAVKSGRGSPPKSAKLQRERPHNSAKPQRGSPRKVDITRLSL